MPAKTDSSATLKDARRRPIAVSAEDYLPPQNGQHLMLTIDANIQMIAEQELADACETSTPSAAKSSSWTRSTGDVLALANWPTFNPQNLEDSTTDIRRNRCLTDPYEPGSTIKPFIAGPALAVEHHAAQRSLSRSTARSTSRRMAAHVTDVHGYDQLALWDVLVKSSNIGMSMLGERMGNAEPLASADQLRISANRPGSSCPAKIRGLINPLKKWTKYSTESVSQGYELMVTPLQLARSMCAYANGGRLVQPRLVKGVLDDRRQRGLADPGHRLQMLPEVIDPITAAEVKRILCDVPIRGTATKARSKTWNIFGKTGTAHVSKGGAYNQESYTSSFIGGGPYENPRLVIAIIIHEPDKEKGHYGGLVSAPSASRVLERTLAYLQVPASPALAPPPPQIANVLYGFDVKVYSNRSTSHDAAASRGSEQFCPKSVASLGGNAGTGPARRATRSSRR